MKLRTMNGKGRHLSTARAIEILEEYGVETPEGWVRLPPGLLSKATANRYLRQWGYDHERITRPPAAVRFQAEQSNALWHFDLSPSDLKQIECPPWVEPGRGAPTLMIYSVVDDRSGVVYQEYRCVYGEDVEAGLRFLFNAMAPKPEEDGSPFQGIPAAIYCDGGPIAKSGVFRRVMEHLGIAVLSHLPAGKDGRRPTARAKGKVERPFRTVKEAHETLYHFHKPETEAEANRWLRRFVAQYNTRQHRSEPHSGGACRRLASARAVLDGCPALAAEAVPTPRRQAFTDPDPFREFTFSNRITAKLAIAAALGMPLGRLTEAERAFIDAVLAETLERRTVMQRVLAQLRPERKAGC
jgi:hypothetical protein